MQDTIRQALSLLVESENNSESIEDKQNLITNASLKLHDSGMYNSELSELENAKVYYRRLGNDWNRKGLEAQDPITVVRGLDGNQDIGAVQNINQCTSILQRIGFNLDTLLMTHNVNDSPAIDDLYEEPEVDDVLE